MTRNVKWRLGRYVAELGRYVATERMNVGVKIGHDGIDVRKSSEKPNLSQNFKSREDEQPKRIARRAWPRHEPARPASLAATRASSPGELPPPSSAKLWEPKFALSISV
ncbi:hypothetical protein DY000_02020405 [Brassica cretica]|uniref:Uncharacterized protein n=1 Tax=Brassica cretica TaxID=69181 RepID=A0ABQ7DZV7_BRACR|nr:hypothetical protein DY000_02020405 [Brassica cretica]